MYVDVASGLKAQCGRLSLVPIVGIRDTKGKVEGTARITPVDRVGPFGRSPIALSRLVPDRRETQRDAVVLQYLLLPLQFHPARALVDVHLIGLLGSGCQRGSLGGRREAAPHSCHELPEIHGAHD